MKTELIRIEQNEGTFGVFVIEDELFAWTIEKPWLDNIPFESCIPEGTYTCRRMASSNFGETFEVMDVEGRTKIRFHWGSFVSDYKGCIGFGKLKRKIGIRHALRDTKDAFEAFMRRMAEVDEFELSIRSGVKNG